MTLSPRSQRKIASIKEQASILFVRHGFHDVTMERIAQYANVSKVTLYKYYKDKQALYEAIILENNDADELRFKDIIQDMIPYPEKVDNLFKAELEIYFNDSRPNLTDDITLTLEATKQVRNYRQRVKRLRAKLWNQGRMEEFIPEEVNDKILETFYRIILSGLIEANPSIVKLDEPEVPILFNTLLAGIKKMP